jgi:polysaccharide pyruvyl transferase WcaK-like protein
MRLLVCNAHRSNANGSPGNSGDAALLSITADWLMTNCDDLTVTLAHGGSPGPAGDGFTRVAYRDLGAPSAAIRAADAVVVAGGTVLADDQPGSLVRGHPRTMATLAYLAQRARRPLVLVGVGAEPVQPGFKRTLLGYAVSRAESIAVRDERSAEILGDTYGIGAKVATGGDLYWLRPPTPLRQRSDGSAGRVVFALRSADFAALFRDRRVPDGSICLAMDSTDLDARHDHAGLDARVHLIVPQSWAQAHEVIAGAGLVVASRMHALYFAAGTGVPAVAVCSVGKVRSFADEFGLPTFNSIGDALGHDLSSIGAVPADPQSVGDARVRVDKVVREALSAVGVRFTG